MAKKGKSKVRPQKERPSSKARDPSYWTVVAIIAMVFLVGLIAKMAFFPSETPSNTKLAHQTLPQTDEPFERKVRLVAAEFRCACDGCGELPLIECDCDMPRGARGEKNFIRDKIREGRPVEEVIRLVEELYGHRIT